MTDDARKSRTEEEIDQNLRRAFEDISQQKIPDRFEKLLAALKDAEATSAGGRANEQ